MAQMQTDWSIPGYRLQGPLGSGGMGDLFLAVDEATGQEVVIKTAPPTADEQTRQRLCKEHKLLLATDHPNIARVLDHGCQDDRPYVVLQYVRGTSLRELMTKGEPMSWNMTASIIRQLSDALSDLHAKNILHRDIKPENVLIDDRDHVTLIDLSIGVEVENLGNLTRQDQILGTVDYMAPEQRHGLGIDARTDEYSLAAMTFEMLTGHCALGQFRKPSELNSSLSTDADDVILKGLERDPDDRYPSVASFVDALLASGPGYKKLAPSGRRIFIEASAIFAALAGCVLVYLVTSGSKTSTANSAVSSTVQLDQPSLSDAGRTSTNNFGMNFVLVPAGEFEMGSSSDELLHFFHDGIPPHIAAETPKHSVSISKPFWIGQYEVTVAQFREFVDDQGYETTSEKWAKEYGRSPMQPIWNSPARYETSDDMPVTAISRDDAMAFCKWLSERDGLSYRLPTEAEWEYACRAGTVGPWHCAEGELSAYSVSSRPWQAGPLPVGQRRSNPWGLYDMHGNVWEWCQDHYSATFFDDAPPIDPLCRESDDGSQRFVLRGGAYKAAPVAVRSTIRRGHENSEAHADRGHAIGFRVVCEDLRTRIASRGQ